MSLVNKKSKKEEDSELPTMETIVAETSKDLRENRTMTLKEFRKQFKE